MTRMVRVCDRTAESLTSFYWLLLPFFILQCLYYGDYRGRVRRYGVLLGIALELFRGATTINAHAFKYQYDQCHWSGRQITRYLQSKGIPVFGWVWVDGFAYFHVPVHKARWADVLLRQAQITAY